MNVYVLWHNSSSGHSEDAKLIGIYSNNNNAQEAISRLQDKPGFRDHPEGFEISTYVVDKDGWVEGFITANEAAFPPEGQSPLGR
jgi:hypothetical protein